MASVVSAFPVSARKQKGGYGRFLDGQIWRLVKGEDFTASLISARSGIYIAAYREGMKVRICLDRSGGAEALIVQATTVAK